MTHRAALATYPDPWRQRWGELSAALEDQGIAWPDSELEAFDRITAEKALGGPAYAATDMPVAIVAPARKRQRELIGAPS